MKKKEVVRLIAPRLVEALDEFDAYDDFDDLEQDAPEITKITPLDALAKIGENPQWLVTETGLNINAVMRALMGGSQRIHKMTAALIADALGYHVREIDWPSDLTHLGRTPLTGRPYGRRAVREVVNVCQEHFLIMQGGCCSYCPS